MLSFYRRLGGGGECSLGCRNISLAIQRMGVLIRFTHVWIGGTRGQIGVEILSRVRYRGDFG